MYVPPTSTDLYIASRTSGFSTMKRTICDSFTSHSHHLQLYFPQSSLVTVVTSLYLIILLHFICSSSNILRGRFFMPPPQLLCDYDFLVKSSCFQRFSSLFFSNLCLHNYIIYMYICIYIYKQTNQTNTVAGGRKQSYREICPNVMPCS